MNPFPLGDEAPGTTQVDSQRLLPHSAATEGLTCAWTDDPEYQRFVAEQAKHCHCRPGNCPCDGVLAGGMCDDIQDDPDEEYEIEDQAD